MKTATQIAQFFLHHAYDGEKDQVSNLKLQKLLYYAQGYSLALLNKPLFKEPIQCWTHGPVVESVYHQYKVFGKRFITSTQVMDLSIFNSDEMAILTLVANEYGQYSAWKLREMTHDEAPWCYAYDTYMTVIPNVEIQQYFKQKLSDSQLSCAESNDERHAYQYDVKTMQDSIESGSIPVPDFETSEEFIAWLNA